MCAYVIQQLYYSILPHIYRIKFLFNLLISERGTLRCPIKIFDYQLTFAYLNMYIKAMLLRGQMFMTICFLGREYLHYYEISFLILTL